MKTEQSNDETTFEIIKRNRTIAIVLGTIVIVALFSLVYAFKQKSEVGVQAKRADSLQLLSDSLQVQVQKYIDANARQKKLAEENAKFALKEKQKAEATKKHTAKPTASKSKKTKPKK